MNIEPSHADLYLPFDDKNQQIISSYAVYLHPNPHFWKYKWNIFHDKSPEGKQFFKTPELSTKEAMDLIESLKSHDKGCLIYNRRLPRQGMDVPFDFSNYKWADYEIAPAYEDDLDPVWTGHK